MSSKDSQLGNIPDTVREFRFANFVVIITRSRTGSIGLVWKNIEDPKHHHTLVVKDENASMHYTLEDTKNQHRPIDHEKFLMDLESLIDKVLKNAESLSLTDPRFAGKDTIVVTGHHLIIEKAAKKRVDFGQELEYYEAKFEDIDLSKNGFGTVSNDDEETMIIVQNGQIFRLDLSNIEEDSEKLDCKFKPKINSNETNKHII